MEISSGNHSNMKLLTTTILFCIIFFANLQAQFVVQEGTMTVDQPNAVISVNQSFNNNGNIKQSGTLVLGGDLSNLQNFDASEALIILNGENQKIQSNKLSVQNLIINNGHIKTIEGEVEITNVLQLNDGKVMVNQDDGQITLENGVAVYANENSYVIGNIFHRGIGDKFFPVGDQNTYAPVTLYDLEGESPTVGIAYSLKGKQPYWRQMVKEGTYNGALIEVSFPSQNEDQIYYQDYLQLKAGLDQSATNTLLGASSVYTTSSNISITSKDKTNLSWLTIGFIANEAMERVYVPTAFSSQASNVEDQIIKVYGNLISFRNFHFGIQDAWGKWVYETNSLEKAMGEGWFNYSSSNNTYRYVLSGSYISGASFQQSDVIMRF